MVSSAGFRAICRRPHRVERLGQAKAFHLTRNGAHLGFIVYLAVPDSSDDPSPPDSVRSSSASSAQPTASLVRKLAGKLFSMPSSSMPPKGRVESHGFLDTSSR